MTDTTRITRYLAEIARLALRLKDIDSLANRERLHKLHNGDLSRMYAEMYGGAEMIAQLMADAAERALAEVSQ